MANASILQCGRYRLPVGDLAPPLVMGILNVTPDSFSDGGRHRSLDSVISAAEQMLADGVDIIDIGGESTRPGATPVTEEEELRRVLPAIYALRDCGKPLSIDTYKPGVMRQAVAAGVDLVNDVNAFRHPGAIDAVSDSDCALCVMHMRDTPATMQQAPAYDDVVAEVARFLNERVAVLEAAGVVRARLLVDPGFGFGKTQAHNTMLVREIDTLRRLTGLPLLAGLSRKSLIGQITGRPVEERVAGSVAAAMAAVLRGASIVRVHDVAATVDALKVWHALTM